jgi:phosphate transport system ATP-binding protein
MSFTDMGAGDQAIRPRVRIQTGPIPAAAPGAVPGLNGAPRPAAREAVFDARNVSVRYGDKPAIDAINLKIYRNVITALIGPSGCGKTTFLRSLNRMNDSIPSFRLEGQVLYHGHDLYDARANRVEVRRRIGMVFQKPNPFPK